MTCSSPRARPPPPTQVTRQLGGSWSAAGSWVRSSATRLLCPAQVLGWPKGWTMKAPGWLDQSEVSIAADCEIRAHLARAASAAVLASFQFCPVTFTSTFSA